MGACGASLVPPRGGEAALPAAALPLRVFVAGAHTQPPRSWADVRWILRSFVVTHAAKLAAVPDIASWDSALDAVATDFLSRKLVNVCGDDGQLMPAAASEDMSLFSAIVDGFLSVGTGGEERTLTPRSGGSPRGSGGSEVVHRVALFRQGKVTSILSQSDCMTCLFRHPELLGAQLWAAKVSELGFLGRRTVCVEPHTPAHAAFAVMFGHGVSGVGVVGHNEELIANLSASDLRTLTNFRVLALPVLDFLDRAAEGQGTRRGPPVAVTPDTPFSSVLQMLGGGGPRVHRVYITHNGKPVGVITATDVLKLLVRLEEGDLTEILAGPPA